MRMKRSTESLEIYKHIKEKNRRNLFWILKENENTFWGRKYHFGEIKDLAAFRQKVPLSKYEDYPFGNESSYETQNIILTSGSTNRPKKIFLTKEALNRYGSHIYDVPRILTKAVSGRSVHTNVFPEKEPMFLSSAYYRYLFLNHRFSSKDFVDGAILFSDKKFSIPYAKLRLALACEDLVSIQSVYLVEILCMIGYLEKHWKMILEDLSSEKISGNFPPEIQKVFRSSKASLSRIRTLKQIFETDRKVPPLEVLWPNLKYVSGIGSEEDYDVKRLKKYLLKTPIYYFSYASSECMAGISVSLNEDAYVLLPDSAFYEFLDDTGHIYLPEEVEVGKNYELIVTTFNGFYRYHMNDVLKIVGFEGENPKFKVLGRKELILDVAGEKTTEEMVKKAFYQLSVMLHLDFPFFQIREQKDEVPPRYSVLTNLSPSLFPYASKTFDEILRKINYNYHVLRKNEIIASPQWIFCEYSFSDLSKKRKRPPMILSEKLWRKN